MTHFNKIVLILALLVLTPFSVLAGIYKCVDDGKTTFQQTPCQEGKQETLKEYTPVFGMHGSWFSTPEKLKYSATCNDIGCSCGSVAMTFTRNETDTLLDSMNHLQSTWQNHSRAIKSRNKALSRNHNATGYDKSISNAACNVSIHQKIIKSLFEQQSNEIIVDQEMNEMHHKSISKQCKTTTESGWIKGEEAQRYVECRARNSKVKSKSLKMTKKSNSQLNIFNIYYEQLKLPRQTF